MDQLIGQLSKHEMDIQYLSEITGDNDLKFARSKDVAIDVTMTNLVRAYKFENQTFIADKIAPIRRVTSRIGRYKNRGKEAVNIDVSDLLSDRGAANEIGFAVSESTYAINPRGLCAFVSDDEAEENGAINAASEAVILLQAAAKLRQEIRVRNLADATSNTATPAVNWDTSTVIHTDVNTGKAAMKAALGFSPNTVVMGDHICDAIVANANIKTDIVAVMNQPDGRAFLEAMSGSDLGKFSPWGLTPVIPDAMYNTIAPGLTQVLARVWQDDVYLIRMDNEARTMNWAFQFELLPYTIVRWRTENPGGTWYKLMYKRVEKEITSEAIYKINDIL